MKIAIDVAGFSAADSDGFRRAMGTWRSQQGDGEAPRRVRARLHHHAAASPPEQAEELFGKVAGFASFGFNKSHAAAFARTAYESAFLKLFYPAQFVTGLINAQPMGFYPVEVLINDAKRHGVAVLPVDINASRYRTTTEWVGLPGSATAGRSGHRAAAPRWCARPRWWCPSEAVAVTASRHRRRAATASAWACTWSRASARRRARRSIEASTPAARSTRWPTWWRARSCRRRCWSDSSARARWTRWASRGASAVAAAGGRRRQHAAARITSGRARRSAAGHAPAADARARTCRRRPSWSGWATPTPSSRSTRAGRSWSCTVPALERLGALPLGALADRRPGRVAIGGLVVTRQHPMTARGTVFLALEDETGMVNVTLWPRSLGPAARGRPPPRAALRGGRPAGGVGQREPRGAPDPSRWSTSVASVAVPEHPDGVRQLGHAGMRRVG